MFSCCSFTLVSSKDKIPERSDILFRIKFTTMSEEHVNTLSHSKGQTTGSTFMNALEKRVRQVMDERPSQPNSGNFTEELGNFQLFSCPSCLCFLEEPCTIFCGCTFCFVCAKEILEDCQNGKCPSCQKGRDRISWEQRSNSVLKNILQKWFHKHLESLNSQSQGNCHLTNGDSSEAMVKYDEAVRICKCCKTS